MKTAPAPEPNANLALRLVRSLDLDPAHHPRGVPFLSAASGLVHAHGLTYVICDDERHLGIFSEDQAPGRLLRLLPGDLPQNAKARKSLKPDFETLFHLDARAGHNALIALGSGSKPNRCQGCLIPLDAQGQPSSPPKTFDIRPLYQALLEQFGEINIEGTFIQDQQLVLLNRRANPASPNAVIRYALQDFIKLIEGEENAIRPVSIEPVDLGKVEGVALGFTDGIALPDGGWLYSAVAEDSANSYLDGPFKGALIGRVDASGHHTSAHTISPVQKIEGLAVKEDHDRFRVLLVTDADVPDKASQLFEAVF